LIETFAPAKSSQDDDLAARFVLLHAAVRLDDVASSNTLPTWTRNVPAAICSTNSSSGVSMKSSGPPS
jgi:hypothetical protein